MASIAEFRVAADEFPLGTIFEEYPGVTVEFERLIPTDRETIPYFWVEGVEHEIVDEAFLSHPAVSEVRFIDEANGNFLYRIHWNPNGVGMLTAINETDVTLLSATGSSDEWVFQIRGETHEAISAFQAYCLDHDIPVRLKSLHALSEMEDPPDFDLTDAQREALVLAFERGYFSSPRESTLEEIAEELGISRQALAGRLQRGHERLIASTIIG